MKLQPKVMVVVALLAPALVLAQGQTRMPTDAEIKVERERVEAGRKAMFDSGSGAEQQPARGAFPSIATPKPSEVDIGAIAGRYRGVAENRRVADGLVVFASLSMPKPSLQKLIADTARAGGSVLLRGFKDGSFKATAVAINKLAGSAGAASVQINPDAFVKYRVKAVPTVALLRTDAEEKLDAEGCALPDAYASVAGDVGLDYALKELEKRAPRFRDLARRYGRSLQGGLQ